MKKLLLVLFFVMFLCSVNVFGVLNNTGLEAVWKFEDDKDTLNNHNLSTNGVPIFVAGKDGNCAQLDGTNDYFSLTQKLSGTINALTLNFWVYGHTWNTNDYIFEFGSGGAGYLTYGYFNAGSLIYNWFPVATQPDGYSGYASPFSINKWYMVTLVYNTTGEYVYYNGTLTGSDTTGTPATATWDANPQSIGTMINSDVTRTFDGCIDEVVLFTNRSLSSSEVGELWNSGTGKFYPFSPIAPVAVNKINITYPSADGQVFNSSFTLNVKIHENISNIDYGYYVFNGVDYYDIRANFTLNNSCYQESSDINNQTGKDGYCGLDYSGTYDIDAVSCNSGSQANMHDGDWTTYCYRPSFGIYYVNYTIPTYTVIAIWDVKAQNEYNFTISQNCLAGTLQLKYVDSTPPNWQSAYCFDYTLNSFVSVGSNAGYSTFFEEAVRWVVQQDYFYVYADLIPRSGNNNFSLFVVYLNGSNINASRIFNLTPNVTYNYTGLVLSRQYANFSFVVQKPDVSLSDDNFSTVFYYNNTVFSPSVTQDNAGNISYFYSILTPNISSGVTKLFYWNTSILGGDVYNYSGSHTLTTISILNCSAGFSSLVNVSVFYENIFGNLLTSDFEYVLNAYFFGDYGNPYVVNASFNDSASFSICLNTSGINYTYDLYAQYFADGGFRERIYLYKQNSSSTQYIYAGNYNSTTETTILNLNVKDDSYLAYKNVVANLQRYYVSENVWRTVQWDKSDEYGRMLFNIKEKDTDYRIKFYDTNNVLLKSTDVIKFFCVGGYCDLVQLISSIGSGSATNLSVSNNYDNVTQIVTTTWVDPTNLTSSVRIYVTKEQFNNRVVICNNTVAGSSGTVSCDVSSYNGTIGVRVFSSASPERAVYTFFFSKLEQTLANILGTRNSNLWAGLLMVTVSSFGVVVSPVVGMALAVFGLILLAFLGVVNVITVTLIGLVIVVAIVLAIKVQT